MFKDELIICTGHKTCTCNCPGKEPRLKSEALKMSDNCYHDPFPCCGGEHSDGNEYSHSIVSFVDLKRVHIVCGFASKALNDMVDCPAKYSAVVRKHFWEMI